MEKGDNGEKRYEMKNGTVIKKEKEAHAMRALPAPFFMPVSSDGNSSLLIRRDSSYRGVLGGRKKGILGGPDRNTRSTFGMQPTGFTSAPSRSQTRNKPSRSAPNSNATQNILSASRFSHPDKRGFYNVLAASPKTQWYRKYAATLKEKDYFIPDVKRIYSVTAVAGKDKSDEHRSWWLFDTGANTHATNNLFNFFRVQKLPANAPSVITANGPVKPTIIGDVRIYLNALGDRLEITLGNVLFFPTFPIKIFNGERFLDRDGSLGIKDEKGNISLYSHDGTKLAYLNTKLSGCYLYEWDKMRPIKYKDNAPIIAPVCAGVSAIPPSVVDESDDSGVSAGEFDDSVDDIYSDNSAGENDVLVTGCTREMPR